MCGIIGVISKSEVSGDLCNGLLSLQHRGQDAAGITTFGGEFHAIKEAGLVSTVFSKEHLKKLEGNLGIGHVRYPTCGTVLRGDSQPFYTERPTLISIAQNGNIVNYNELKEEMIRGKEIFDTQSDGELILKMLASEVSKEKAYDADSFFNATRRMMDRLNGSYSIVGMTAKALFAFRDPFALRPLILGRKADSYAIASETVALETIGYKVERDIQAGEMVFIDKSLHVKSKILKEAKPAHCMFEWVYFARPDSVLDKVGVYEARLNLGRELAKLWKETGKQVDVVIPVPDTARPSAVAFAEELGLKYTEGFIKNRYIQRTFIMANQEKRDGAMKLKLNPLIKEVKGRRIALLDDSLVRGTTSRKIIQLLRDAGAKEVHFLLTCPPIRSPCFYGIDMSTKKELIAVEHSVEEIRKTIGADSLIYQTLEGLKRAIALPLCTACLDGVYPTNISEQTMARFERQREEEKQFHWSKV
jgi:amidophosphoribosyltransferase